MRGLIVNSHGGVEVDPFNKKGEFEAWLASISKGGELNYRSLRGVSVVHSEFITRYVLDLASGRNTAKGHKKGPRSYVHLVHVRFRLLTVLRFLEKHTGKTAMDFSEDDVLGVFNGMRLGTIKCRKGTAFLDVGTYAKAFCAFWRWHMRTQRKEGRTIPDVVDCLDTSSDVKPKWFYFKLTDVERMVDIAPYFEYKALVFFLF